jgi:hypothetical protein
MSEAMNLDFTVSVDKADVKKSMTYERLKDGTYKFVITDVQRTIGDKDWNKDNLQLVLKAKPLADADNVDSGAGFPVTLWVDLAMANPTVEGHSISPGVLGKASLILSALFPDEVVAGPYKGMFKGEPIAKEDLGAAKMESAMGAASKSAELWNDANARAALVNSTLCFKVTGKTNEKTGKDFTDYSGFCSEPSEPLANGDDMFYKPDVVDDAPEVVKTAAKSTKAGKRK